METIEIAPPPRFLEVRRESALQEHIWCVKTRESGTFVSRSVPAIIKAMHARGVRRWPTAIYRPNHRHTRAIRCKTAEQLNAALDGEDGAVFVVSNPDCWIIARGEEKDAAIVSGSD